MKVLSLLKSYADSNRLSEIGIGLAGPSNRLPDRRCNFIKATAFSILLT